MLIVPGARKLWAEHGQEAAELEALCRGKPHVTREDAETLLRNEGLLPAEVKGRAPTKGKTGTANGAARAGTSAGRAIQEAPSEAAGDPLLDDVAMLDGNRIEVEWPQTRPGKGTRPRTRIGTVRHLPKQERHTQENVYLVEFERRAKTAAKGVRLRKTSWAKLCSRKYKTISSERPKKAPRAKWTEEELEAVRIRSAAGELSKSTGIALGRAETAINGKRRNFEVNSMYAAATKGVRAPVKSGVTLELVVRAMLQLQDASGTAKEIREQVMAIATRESIELDGSLAPGQCTLTRCESSTAKILSTYAQLFRQMPNKQHTGRQLVVVYQYIAPDVSAERPQPLALVGKHVKWQTPNPGGPKLSRKRKAEKMAGGDRRYGD